MMAWMELVDGAFGGREVDVLFLSYLPYSRGSPMEELPSTILDGPCRTRVGIKHEIQFQEVWL